VTSTSSFVARRARARIRLAVALAAAISPALACAGVPPAAEAPAGPVATFKSHGMTIPASHPRLWFDAARLARARAWYGSNSFTPRGDADTLALSQATHGILARSRSSCRAALDWAIRENDTLGKNANAESSSYMDRARWYGQVLILTYDWCFEHMTPEERTRFVEQANLWIEARRQSPWYSAPMHQNNYYWGFLRNQLLWGIASYDVNQVAAERFISDAIDKRLVADFHPATLGESRGGVCQEGSQYGPYLTGYSVVPFSTAGLLGRELYEETPFWKEAVYANIYATTPGPTVTDVPLPGTTLGYLFFPHSDLDVARWRDGMLNADADFMLMASQRWGALPIGQHARQWLKITGALPSRHVVAVDPGGIKARPFQELPLDYYASGVKYLYGRSAWTPTATAFLLQLGDRNMEHVGGHQHIDWGSWEIWRNGRFVSRETPAYGDKVAGYAGGPPVEGMLDLAHNLLLVEGRAISTSAYSHAADARVTRLESRPGYVFAAVDLTRTLGSKPEWANRHFVRWVREFVFVRGLETLVVLDRVESDHPGDTKTFLAHCESVPATTPDGAVCTVGSQALAMKILVPAQRSSRVVYEGKPAGQQRIEFDTRPGTAQSYVLAVLQAKDARAPALTPTVAEDAGSFTVKLNGATSLRFEKGMASSGGVITLGETTRPLAAGVQEMVVTDQGPVWR
jgi:hypothetical protein